MKRSANTSRHRRVPPIRSLTSEAQSALEAFQQAVAREQAAVAARISAHQRLIAILADQQKGEPT